MGTPGGGCTAGAVSFASSAEGSSALTTSETSAESSTSCGVTCTADAADAPASPLRPSDTKGAGTTESSDTSLLCALFSASPAVSFFAPLYSSYCFLMSLIFCLASSSLSFAATFAASYVELTSVNAFSRLDMASLSAVFVLLAPCSSSASADDDGEPALACLSCSSCLCSNPSASRIPSPAHACFSRSRSWIRSSALCCCSSPASWIASERASSAWLRACADLRIASRAASRPETAFSSGNSPSSLGFSSFFSASSPVSSILSILSIASVSAEEPTFSAMVAFLIGPCDSRNAARTRLTPQPPGGGGVIMTAHRSWRRRPWPSTTRSETTGSRR